MGAVLLVEADPEIRESLEALLLLEGYDASSAASSVEALRLLRSGEAFSLILLDLTLSAAGELRAALLRDPELASIPVVVLSGGDEARFARPLDVAGCLRKPIRLSELLTVVARHCGPTGTPDLASAE